MSNSLLIKNRSTMVKQRIKTLFENIKSEYIRGSIKTETEYSYRLFTSLKKYYTNIGKPTMIKRYAWGPPSSVDYNTTMNEIYNDIFGIYTEANAITDSIKDNFEQNELGKKFLENKIKLLEDKLQMINQSINLSSNKTIFKDSFINQTLYDNNKVYGIQANINTQEGVLTLAKIDSEEFREGVTIKILDSSNGFPGNTHQVKVSNNTLVFTGEEDSHLNISQIIDGNIDTWVEYELYEITDKVRQEVSNMGFCYNEGLTWLKSNNEPLSLNIVFEIPIAKILSWISLSPFIPSDKGFTAAQIKQITIDDGKGNKQILNNETESFNEDKIYIFPRQICKYIYLSIEQPFSYETWIGHIYSQEIVKSSINFFDNNKAINKRVENKNGSIENLGLNFNPLNGTATYPLVDQNYIPPDNENIIQNLLTIPPADENTNSGLEPLTGNRYVIGLRDVSLANYRFQTESTYISKPFTTINPINKIQLSSIDQIPEVFSNQDWISYYISIDECQTWHKISPIDIITNNNEIKISYLINSQTAVNNRKKNIGYLDILEDVKSIRIKIDLLRPSDINDADYYSPIVYEYTLLITETTPE